MGKKEEGTVGMNGAIESTATEVEANNMASGLEKRMNEEKESD